MNLTQIERRFKCVELLAGHINYKYNPACPKVEGLKKHIYQDELERGKELDLEIYGAVVFEEDDEVKAKR
jgi:hypothetical protein